MSSKTFIVRLVKPSPEPALPKRTYKLKGKHKKGSFLSKPINIFLGSSIGFAAGIIVFLMLKQIGISFGGLESSIIIGLPSVLGILASIVIC